MNASDPDSEPSLGQPARRRLFSGYGLAFGMVTVLWVFISPWIVEAWRPEPEPFDLKEVVVDIAAALKEEMRPKPDNQIEAANHLGIAKAIDPLMVIPIGLGAIGVCLGVVGFAMNEDPRCCLATVSLSGSAVLLQYLVVFAFALLILVMIIVLVVLLGGG